jgi:predicted O-methyltransferase YrrM
LSYPPVKATVIQQPARLPLFLGGPALICVLVTPETRATAASDLDADPAVLENAAGFLAENEALESARAEAEAVGAASISAAGGAALRFLATAVQAKAVVEVGTGAGVSGLCLLSGMAPEGVLTSIDIEPEYQRTAKRTFVAAGVPIGRVRLIMGQALEVLPRLTDGGYDLVFFDAALAEYPQYHEQGVRLLRPGGVIVFDHVLATGQARRDQETTALREVVAALREDERLVPMLLPLGSGLLVAAKRRMA